MFHVPDGHDVQSALPKGETMNNQQWYAHRAEMHNYMPAMIAFKRKRSGWKRKLENVLVWTLIVVYAVGAFGFIVYSTVRWGWNPVLVLIVEVIITWKPANWLHEFVYAEDTGLHNLEGYDPETGTVPRLEAQGFNTKEFWPNPNHPKYQTRR